MQEKARKREKSLERVWRLLQALLMGAVCRRFNYAADVYDAEGGCIVISNHITTWDPLLLAASFPKKHLHFVASEHIFRHGLLSKLLTAIVDPIPRRKATTGSDTVMMCLRKLKSGGSVAIFAEGDATWNGLTDEIFPATGKLVRAGKVRLVTYRIEGGYLSLPRWSKRLRRGQMKGRIVGVYEPEQLREMTPEQINRLISEDINENAWQRQSREQVHFRGKGLAEGIESGLFLCPGCGRVGSIKSENDRVFCDCGFETRFTELGLFDPPRPFENFYQWDSWQMQALKNGSFEHGEELFYDDGMTLRRVEQGHRERVLGRGRLVQLRDRLRIAGREFELGSISNMAMVKNNTLLFSEAGDYYEIRSDGLRCLRKYLAIWKNGVK